MTRLNLLRPEQRFGRRTINLGFIAGMIGIVFVAVVGAQAYFLHVQLVQARAGSVVTAEATRTLTDQQQQLKDLQSAAASLPEAIKRGQELVTGAAHSDTTGGAAAAPELSELLQQVAQAVGAQKGIWLTDLSYQESQGLSFTGRADDYRTVSAYLAALERQSDFANAHSDALTKQETELGSVVAFSGTAGLPAPTAQPITPAKGAKRP